MMTPVRPIAATKRGYPTREGHHAGAKRIVMNRHLSIWLVAPFMLAAAASTAHAYTGERLEAKAQVKMTDATALALKARPGAITDRELEREGGGSGLRYSFDIRYHGVTYEVGIDAMTGKVLENAPEGKNPD